MNYNFTEIEAKWQKYWSDNKIFQADNNSDKEKFYVLDMFPYPSGAGLHVGHPLGYIASDIYARYKRHKGFNVLHPMGYDSFGLPAEQYAIQTGLHPAVTTSINIDGCLDADGNIMPKYVNADGSIKNEALIDKNEATFIKDENYQENIIKGYRKQLDKIGFSFDWSREVRTSNPDYYKWTQWIFIQLFNSWYNKNIDKAEDVATLIAIFEKDGNQAVQAAADDTIEIFSANEWNAFDTKKQQEILLQYRLTYLAETEVNWCPALGTVLANDEIVNGVSERGGHTVIRKKMTQWSMRISAYAQRLLDDLAKIDWPQPLKDSQTNWIGRSKGAQVEFRILNSELGIEVFTTRPDTIFGVSFMTLAPEHELVTTITTPAQKAEVNAYVEATAKRSERDRMADVKTISGAFTGAYAEHPFTKEPIPIWIGDYVLAGYGTGAVMSVPCGDQRDYDFAKHFNIPIPNIFKDVDISQEAYADKEKTIISNSDFLDGLGYKEASDTAIKSLETLGQGQGKINYRLRDAVFSRQRYWGEPFPVYYVNGMPQMIDAKHLPIKLPEVEKYLPTETGEPPLGNADVWAWNTESHEVVSTDLIDHKIIFPLELNTMPGWAGSSFYFNRYMDPNTKNEIFSKEAIDYWQDVDLYIGGSEHATGHLLYARFWQKFLFDKGLVPKDEFAKKLINQGMITGTSAFVYRTKIDGKLTFVSKDRADDLGNYHVSADFDGDLKSENYDALQKIHADVHFVNASDELDIEAFINWRPEYKDAVFVKEQDGTFKVSREIEKMSKSKYNVVSPDAICKEYGADSLRLYEMFLGPLEQSKPWNTAGITGTHGFLKKLWRLYHTGPDNAFHVTSSSPSEGLGEALKTLHKTIKKVAEDIENFSFNTSVSTFMIAVNELSAQKCTNREILENLLILISPYAPHIAEELWRKLGYTESISRAPFPKFDGQYLVESSKEYPVSFNGKMRFKLELPMDFSKEQIEEAVMAHEKTQQQLDGRTPKKLIIIPGKIINIVG
ncbi:leucine--tRNA ligase [Cellulophaga sp. Hel_I_12]|uniref:leucine--tRNA ligase n=1 Tax=Cellulophaga sp. Hel_I_12 TaxID=1249972 RepID=UPI0006469085|nr:class I tRNA ligase family protein [Cellulophaga sp. Hel_I_12]